MARMKINTKRIIFPLLALVFALGLIGLLQATLVAQAAPLAQTTDPTSTPTAASTTVLTTTPTTDPTATATPTDVVSTTPTAEPTDVVSTTPTAEPTDVVTTTPTAEPTDVVTSTPTVAPTVVITTTPTVTPTTTPTTTPDGFTVEVTGPSEVTVGDTFEVSVVADNIPEPGIFGYQFALNWDGTVLSPVSGTLNLNSDFSVVAKSLVSTGTLEIAVSRQGAVTDLTGPLTLLTVQVQANAVTDPDTTALTLADWKFGRKGGFDVPVDTIINLDVVVVDDTGDDIIGVVKVEGRDADNQAGHIVTDGATLTATTNISGEFTLPNVEYGLYTLTADSAGFLAATCENADHSPGGTTLLETTLLAGDIDDSNVIDITDAVAIGNVFGSTAGETADLNVDGVVDILDLILMAANYGQTSVDNPWVCQ